MRYNKKELKTISRLVQPEKCLNFTEKMYFQLSNIKKQPNLIKQLHGIEFLRKRKYIF